MEQKLDPTRHMVIPSMALPAFRTSLAVDRGTEKNLLVKTWGGLGDQICAEPTLRFAIQHFKDCKVSLASENPELFTHLKFHKVYNLKECQPLWDKYFVFDTIRPPTDIVWQFICHMLVNCVDYPSLCAFRTQLPVKDRGVKLEPGLHTVWTDYQLPEKVVAVHPGKHWPSKTFPKKWWDEVLTLLFKEGITPVIIGADTDENRGTVDVDPSFCIDLRNKLSIMESVYLLQNAKVLLTNDSSPLHMAVSGDAFIGFIASCKHPDFITHWRKGIWSWRMENLGVGGYWDVYDLCPNKEEEVSVEQVPLELLKSWLPTPQKVVTWTMQKLALLAEINAINTGLKTA